jgi:hypothetical protein
LKTRTPETVLITDMFFNIISKIIVIIIIVGKLSKKKILHLRDTKKRKLSEIQLIVDHCIDHCSDRIFL